MNKLKRLACMLMTYILVIANIPLGIFANELNKNQNKIKALFDYSDEQYYVRTAQQYKDKTYIEIYERGNYEKPNTYIIDENNKKYNIDLFEQNGTINLIGNTLKMDSNVSAVEDSSYWDWESEERIIPDLVEINMDDNSTKKEIADKNIVSNIRKDITNKYKDEKIEDISLSDMDILNGWVYYSIYTGKSDIMGVYKDKDTIIEVNRYDYEANQYSFKGWGQIHEDIDGSVYILHRDGNSESYAMSIIKDNKVQKHLLGSLDDIMEKSYIDDFYISKSGEYIIFTDYMGRMELGELPIKIYKFDESTSTYKECNEEIFKSSESIISSDRDIDNNLWFLTKLDGKSYIKIFKDGKLNTKYRVKENLEDIHLNVYDEKNIVLYSWMTSDYPYQRIVNGRFIDENHTGNEGDSSNNEGNTPDNEKEHNIKYQTHIQDYGWQDWKLDGEMSGTNGESKRLEGIKIDLGNNFKNANIVYRTHVQDYGWQEWKRNGEMSGTDGQSKRLEGIEIKLENAPGYKVEYRVHVQDYGWQDWKSNGEMAGTSGEAKRLEGIEVRIVKEKTPDVQYRTHVQDYGWQNWMTNGQMSGTSGEAKRLEGIEIKLENAPIGANIVYQTHVQDYGWQEWKRNGQMSGTDGQSKRLEGIRIKLENAPGYKVEYRVHVQDYGWQEWKSDGEMAGTSGESKRLEGIEVRVVRK